MNRIRIIALILVFLLIEAGAVFYSLASFSKPPEPRPDICIRIGIVPELSKGKSSVDWEPFFNHLDGKFKFELLPYYANSFDEAICGFLNGTIDLLYIDPLSFVKLQQEASAKPLLYHKLSNKERDLNRSVIVSTKDLKYLPDSKGKIIAFSDKNSMPGFIIPEKFLQSKLGMPLANWFSSVLFAGSSGDAAEMLLTGKADIIAGNWLEISDFFANLNLKEDEVKVLWMSKTLPENLICISPGGPYANERTYWEDLDNYFESQMTDSDYNRKSMFFAPVDLRYKQGLGQFEKFMDERKTYSADSIFIPN